MTTLPDLSLQPIPQSGRQQNPPQPAQFTREEIYQHFKQGLQEVDNQLNFAKRLPENEREACENIWRAQVVFLESSLDFYIHEISKYALHQMFIGRRGKSAKYGNLQISLKDLEDILSDEENRGKRFFTYLNERFSRSVFLGVDAMRDQLNLIGGKEQGGSGFDFREVMTQAFQSEDVGKRKVKDLFERRNAIAHQNDRSHDSAERTPIDENYVIQCRDDIRALVKAIDTLVEAAEIEARATPIV